MSKFIQTFVLLLLFTAQTVMATSAHCLMDMEQMDMEQMDVSQSDFHHAGMNHVGMNQAGLAHEDMAQMGLEDHSHHSSADKQSPNQKPMPDCCQMVSECSTGVCSLLAINHSLDIDFFVIQHGKMETSSFQKLQAYRTNLYRPPIFV